MFPIFKTLIEKHHTSGRTPPFFAVFNVFYAEKERCCIKISIILWNYMIPERNYDQCFKVIVNKSVSNCVLYMYTDTQARTRNPHTPFSLEDIKHEETKYMYDIIWRYGQGRSYVRLE